MDSKASLLVDDLNQAGNDSSVLSEKVEDNLIIYSNQLQDQIKEIERLQSLINSMKKESEEKEKKLLETKEKELKLCLEETHNRSNEEIQKLKDSLAEFQVFMNRIDEEKEKKWKEQISDMIKSNELLRNEIDSLKKEILTLLQELENSKQDFVELEKRKNEIERNLIEKNEREVFQLNQNIERLNREKHLIEVNLNDSNQQNCIITEELAFTKQQNVNHQNDILLLKQQIISLQKDKEKMEKALLESNEKAIREIHELKRENEVLKSDHVLQVNSLSKKLEASIQEDEKNKKKIEELKREIEDRDRMLEKSSIQHEDLNELLSASVSSLLSVHHSLENFNQSIEKKPFPSHNNKK